MQEEEKGTTILLPCNNPVNHKKNSLTSTIYEIRCSISYRILRLSYDELNGCARFVLNIKSKYIPITS